MSPSLDQARIAPPKVVMIRLWPSRMLPREYQLNIPGTLREDPGTGRRHVAFNPEHLLPARAEHLDIAAKQGMHPGTAVQGDVAVVHDRVTRHVLARQQCVDGRAAADKATGTRASGQVVFATTFAHFAKYTERAKMRCCSGPSLQSTPAPARHRR